MKADPLSREEESDAKTKSHELLASPIVHEMSTGQASEDRVELTPTSDAWIQRKKDAKAKQERGKALVDDRVAAGYEGAYRGN